MSLNAINHTLTTSVTDEQGVTWWTNPSMDVKINSKGKVVSLKTGKEKPKTNIGYTFRVINDKISKSTQASFDSLFCRVVLGKKLRGCSFFKLDETKPYSEESYKIVNNTTGTSTVKGDILKVTSEQQEAVILDINTTGNTTTQYYTVYEAKNEHITEDGAIFPTKELAEWHQDKVSKGKGNAQVVLDYNGGYVLAEQIYLQEVVYNKAKPYANFIDVLNNNQGIVSVVQDEHCKFDKLDNEHGFRSEICFMTLRKQLPEQVSKHQAQKIQGALERYSNNVKALDESVVGLEALLKQVK